MSDENVTTEVTEDVVDEANGSTEEEVHDPKALLKAHKELKKDLDKYKADVAAYKTQLEDTAPKADKYKDRAVKAEAKMALQDAGIKNPERILKVINLSDLDFDDDGNLAGLQGRIAELKEELPELFVAKLRAGNVDQHENTTPPTKQLTATELQYQQFIKGR